LWIQAITGMELDAEGTVRVLPAPTWSERRHRLAKLGGPLTAVEDIAARHRQEAAYCERKRQWYAAAFHLTPLLLRDPGDAPRYPRRGHAYYELSEWTKAAADYAKAIQFGIDTKSDWLRHAWLRFAVGDHAGYRKACDSLLLRFGRTDNPADAYTLAW